MAVSFLVLGSYLWAASLNTPDVVRVTIENRGANELAFVVDHPSHSDTDAASPVQHLIVEVACAAGVDNPVAFTNRSNETIEIFSPIGVASLVPQNDFGAHSATFRSVPKGKYVFAVRDPWQAGKFKAALQLICRPGA